MHRRCVLDSLVLPVASKSVAGGVALGAILGIATDQWGVIGVGLIIGIIARWAYLMSIGNRVTPREALIDFMMVLPNGVLAVNLVDTAHIHDARLLLVAAMLGSGSTLAFVYARAQFNRWAGNTLNGLPTTIFTGSNSTVHIPASSKVDVEVKTVGYATPQSVSEITLWGVRAAPPLSVTEAMAATLEKLGDTE